MDRMRVYLLAFGSLLLVTVAGEIEVGSTKQCEEASWVPGHNLAGEGFDVVTMERKGSYVIDTEIWNKGNGTCKLVKNEYFKGKKQKVPVAVVYWRALPTCSMKMTSQLFESSEALVNDSSSSLGVSWKVGLNCNGFGAGVGSSHSRESTFAMTKSKQDKYSFTKHEAGCSFYRYKLTQKPPLHKEFVEAVKSLPASYDQSAYQDLINTFGTHYILDVNLGGKMKAITAFKTCQAAVSGLTDTAVKDCLDAEAIYSSVQVKASFCHEKKKKMGTKESFSRIFSERQTDIIGGTINGEDLMFSGSSHPNSLNKWVESLKSLPDIVKYKLRPLHLLLSPQDPARKNIKKAIEVYLNENALKKICSEPCNVGKKCSKRDRCVCVCTSSQVIKSNCCPAEKGLATLEVYHLYARKLYGDVTTQTDGKVEVTYAGQTMRTRIIDNNDNPNWPEYFNFGSVKLNMNSILHFKVLDDDGSYSNDDLLGTCSFRLRSGTGNGICDFKYGNFYYTYRIKCAPGLQGSQCDQLQPSVMPAYLAEVFASRNGVLAKDMWKLELIRNNSNHFSFDASGRNTIKL